MNSSRKKQYIEKGVLYVYYPLKFESIYKERVWGSNRLASLLNKELPQNKSIGESWEISAHQEGVSVVSNGIFCGVSLQELIKNHGEHILGSRHEEYLEKFPLLIKFIDANDRLSVQVHPDNEYALANEGELGKTEAWYIIDAKPNAKLIYGLKQGITPAVFNQLISEGRIMETLNEIEVKAGDFFYIPAGTIHAIGEGIIVAEIQQNSDTTYRVYDWDRMGLDGNPRELHIPKALDVIDFSINETLTSLTSTSQLGEHYHLINYISSPFFSIEFIEIKSHYNGSLSSEKFEILIAIEGCFVILYGENQVESIPKGTTLLLPASLGDYVLQGKGQIIRTYI